jgi:predicted thioesterase
MTSEAPRPEVGVRGTAALMVGPEHTAQAFGSGNVPVFATPRLVALMEEAAVNAVGGRLGPGETTVGIRIDIAHLAATPVGQQVRAEARLSAVQGRILKFDLSAYDAQEQVGSGTHERAIVDERRFLERVRQKAGSSRE